ncbi:MAG: RES domain-containing protein, partial [Capsulimonadaceae bacterium]
MVLVGLPPPEHCPKPLFHTLKHGSYLVRLFDPTRFNQGALTFREYGPLRRFDHQLPSDSGPTASPDRGIYYGALNLSSCVVEIFGDTGVIDCGEWRVSRARITRALRLINLR